MLPRGLRGGVRSRSQRRDGAQGLQPGIVARLLSPPLLRGRARSFARLRPSEQPFHRGRVQPARGRVVVVLADAFHRELGVDAATAAATASITPKAWQRPLPVSGDAVLHLLLIVVPRRGAGMMGGGVAVVELRSLDLLKKRRSPAKPGSPGAPALCARWGGAPGFGPPCLDRRKHLASVLHPRVESIHGCGIPHRRRLLQARLRPTRSHRDSGNSQWLARMS